MSPHYLKPISLTPALSKVAERFVVHAFVARAILEIALVSMQHTWAQATDETSAAVRMDYRKAFDSIDHQTLVNKVLSLRVPQGVALSCVFLIF